MVGIKCEKIVALAPLQFNNGLCFTSQMLFHSTAFIQWLEKYEVHRLQCLNVNCLVCALCKLREDYNAGSIVSAAKFFNSLESKAFICELLLKFVSTLK